MRTFSRILRVLLSVVTGVYFGYGLLLWALQERLIFAAPGGISRDALDQVAAEVGAAPVDLVASDGTALYAWHQGSQRRPGQRPRLAIYFGGNAEAVSDNLAAHRLLLKAGFDVLSLAYRGYPGSAGSPDEAGLALDAEAAWAWAVGPGGYPPERVIVYGRSLGGGVASKLVAGPANPAALVLESTFSSLTEVARAHLTLPYPLSWLLRNPFDSRSAAPHFGVPVFVMHSEDDEVIPIAVGGPRLAELVADVELHRVSGLGHNEPIPTHREDVRVALVAFLDRAVTP